ncbi:fructokinase [Magnetospira thiophila]
MRIGIDLGGTKIEGIALGNGGQELARRRVPTPAGDYHGTVAAIVALVEDLERHVGRRGTVGVGIPGTLSAHTGRVKNANSTCLIGQPLDRDLAEALQREVVLANDANCFAMSEAIDGAGAGHGLVFGVILGTGVGGALVIHQHLHVGPNAIAGEWGHNPLPWPQRDAETSEWPGPDCYCGKTGCIETFLSGPGLARDYGRRSGADPAVDNALRIVALAEQGDSVAERTLQAYEQRLARALASVINVVDPDVIVLGGGLSNIDRLYKNVPTLWQEWIFSDHAETPLVANAHGDSSGVRGAAWLQQPSSGNRSN